MKLSEASPRPHEFFVKGTVLLNYQRPASERVMRQPDFEQAQEHFSKALELHAQVSADRKLDDLTIGKLHYFIGLSLFYRIEFVAADDERARYRELALSAYRKAESVLQPLTSNPAWRDNAQHWLAAVVKSMAEVEKDAQESG